jgi:putative ABC transport system substrate-binding protein
MRKSLIVTGLAAIAMLATVAVVATVEKNRGGYNVALVSIVEIDPITKLREGFRTEFESSNFARTARPKYVEYNAQGDPTLINQVVDRVVASKPDLVYVLGTPIAQALQNRDPDLLIVQGAVTDPVAAGLARSWSGSGKRYIATSDLPPVAKQVALIRELTPRVQRLGVIYNPGEPNSAAVLARLRNHVREIRLPLTVVERPVGNSAEVPTALNSLVGNVDALYLPPDNTAHGAMRLIGQFAMQHRLALYTTVPESLEHGALAALGLDFHELGRESARLALRVVSGGADPSRQPILVSNNPGVHISLPVASNLGLDITAFRGRRGVVISGGT